MSEQSSRLSPRLIGQALPCSDWLAYLCHLTCSSSPSCLTVADLFPTRFGKMLAPSLSLLASSSLAQVDVTRTEDTFHSPTLLLTLPSRPPPLLTFRTIAQLAHKHPANRFVCQRVLTSRWDQLLPNLSG
ncbi:unnamed protein product [Protopolystoma xenopodis]|uniref:Uncharacterized protein n=1 Tax=Protopolystoma xenopodis TaxID=117903 RepID=A0A448XN41_9PLAT|nr:unnamed protein product [Protopolystoma xenopodis]